MRPKGSILGRRAFLRTAAQAGALFIVAPAPSVAAAAPRASIPLEALRVGVLVPTPARYPQMGQQFLQGLNLLLKQRGAALGALQLIHQDVGTLPSAALGSARALVENNQVDLLVAMISAGETAPLHGLLQERGVPLIVSHAGATLGRLGQHSPMVFRNSLGLWRSSWALGAWAARQLGVRAAVAASFHDSGFDSLYTFQAGFERYGGQVLFSRVTHTPMAGPGHLAALMAEIQATKPEVVFASYSGDEAAEFMRAYTDAGLTRQIPLVGPGFLAEAAPAAAGVRTAASWAPSLQSPESRAFVGGMRAAGHAAGPFALLGYDTAALIESAALRAGGPGDLARALAGASYNGARGPQLMDANTHDTLGPLYLREARRGRALIGLLDAPPHDDPVLATLRATERTGWRTAYLAS